MAEDDDKKPKPNPSDVPPNKALVLEPCERPLDPGRRGKPIKLKANVFRLNLIAKQSWFKYTVQITTVHETKKPRILTKELRQIWYALEDTELSGKTNHFGGVRVVYDGRNACFSADTLPGTFLEIPVELRSRGRFIITLFNPAEIRPEELNKWASAKPVSCHQGDAMDALAALNTLFIHCLAGKDFPSTKNVFHIQNPNDIPGLDPRLHAPLDVGGGIQLWRGFFQSVRATPAIEYPGLFTNVNCTSGAFYKPGNLVEFIKNFLGRRQDQELNASTIDDRDRIYLKRLLKNVRVDAEFNEKTKHHGRPIKEGITITSARTTFFFDSSKANKDDPDDKGKEISVEDFFWEYYGVRLRQPHAPCVRINERVSWPAELCSITPGIKYNKKLNSRQQEMASNAKYQAMAPRDRMRAILAVGNESLKIATGTMQAFSLFPPPPGAGSLDLTNVNGRVLCPPKIEFKRSWTQPDKGQWQMKPRGTDALINPASFKSFGIIVSNRNDMRSVMSDIPTLFGKMADFELHGPGRFRPELVVFADNNIPKTMERAMAAADREFGHKAQLFFWIFDNGSDPNYNVFKTEGARLGIATQAIVNKNLSKSKTIQFAVNMALKINVKLGGQNFRTEFGTLGGEPNLPGWFETHPAMIFGADLTHTQDKPSIAAVVASCDRRGFCYEEIVRVQPLAEPPGDGRSGDSPREKTPESGRARKQEIIVNLKEMMVELFLRFAKTTGIAPPNSLVFYRDGVSDGEQALVLNSEVRAIKEAVHEFKNDRRNGSLPKLKDWDPKLTFVLVVKRHHIRFFDGDRNIPPGTIVDSGVVDARAFDWYAAAHAGILGTTRATRYVVLQDDNAMSADDVQTLTNALCHSYQRCNRAVSLPAPTYYAHLVCEKARAWFIHLDDTMTSHGGHGPGSTSVTSETRKADFLQHVEVLKTMEDGRRAFKKSAEGNMPAMWFM